MHFLSDRRKKFYVLHKLYMKISVAQKLSNKKVIKITHLACNLVARQKYIYNSFVYTFSYHKPDEYVNS